MCFLHTVLLNFVVLLNLNMLFMILIERQFQNPFSWIHFT